MSGRVVIDCELPVNLAELMDQIIAQVVEKTGSQFKAAIDLGIRPETISRRLSHRRRKAEKKEAES
jgi:hypothetical protein